jgi:ketosteroid isomerase-like protein
MSDRETVLAADRAFFGALLAADARALDALLAPDFLIVDVAAGGVTARDAFVAGVAARAIKFDAIDSAEDEASVRVHGDLAIVVSRTAMRIVLPDAARIDVRSRYTHVFHRSEAGWRLVSAQGTAIA